MDRTLVEATADDLQRSDVSMHNMVRFVQMSVSQSNPSVAAKNAAIAYRALITGFVEGGLMEIEWAPRLVIEAGVREFELSIDGQDSSSEMSSLASSVGGIKPESRSSQTHSRTMLSRNIGDLLETFLARCRTGHVQLPVSLVQGGETPTVYVLPEVEMPTLGSSNVVWSHLQEIGRLEIQACSVSISTNWAYWRVGSSYEAFFESHVDDLPSDCHPRTRQGLMLSILCQEPSFAHFSADKAAMNQLKKRLQRGRKFFALCRALGTDVLGFAPEISVSRLDLIKLSELEKLHDGSVEKVKVQEILKLAGDSP